MALDGCRLVKWTLYRNRPVIWRPAKILRGVVGRSLIWIYMCRRLLRARIRIPVTAKANGPERAKSKTCTQSRTTISDTQTCARAKAKEPRIRADTDAAI